MIETILFSLGVSLGVQYFAALIIFIIDSTEKEMRYRIINSKRRFICWIVPFGYVVILYYYITNLWKELKDN